MDTPKRSPARWMLLGLAVLLVAAVAVPALAANTQTRDDAPSVEQDGWPDDGRIAAARAAFVEALAAELDLPVAQVDEALTAVREQLADDATERRRAALDERLADAVRAGTLTQEQADAIADAAESGVLGGGGRGHWHGPGHRLRRWFGGAEAPAVDAVPDTAVDDQA